MNPIAIEIKGLTKIYKTDRGSVKALDGLNLAINKGEIFGFLGPNGAGKTTLVKIIATLLKPTSGKVSVFGIDAINNENDVRELIGYAGQDTEKSCYWRLTARENLVYFATALRNMPLTLANKRINELAATFKFTEKLDNEFSTLSGGERQVVVIMRALIHDPKISFFDEPSKSLDPLTASHMRSLIKSYSKEHSMTIILTTHNMHEAEEVCDKIGFLKGSSLKFVGTPSEFKAHIMINDTIKIYTKPNRKILDKLRKISNIEKIKSFDDHFLLRSSDSASSLPELIKLFSNLGIKPKIAIKEPNVEDAFLKLVGK